MKVFIIGAAIIIIFTLFFSFHTDHDGFGQMEELIKDTADSCASAATLYYDEEAYAEGLKVFNQIEGNKVILKTLQKNLNLNANMTFQKSALPDICHYTVYYLDDTEKMTTYQDGIKTATKDIRFPYQFKESKSGYQKKIETAMVIVTIEAGTYRYKASFVRNPEITRTAGYEYKGH